MRLLQLVNGWIKAINDGAGSGIDADTVDGIEGSSFIRNDYTYTTDQTITINDADFIVRDTTDALTRFIWRDHSEGLLYLGSENTEVTLRSDLNANSNEIVNINVIGIGTDSPAWHLDIEAVIPVIQMTSYGVATGDRGILFTRASEGTADAPSAISIGRELGSLTVQGYDGDAFRTQGNFRFYATEDWSATNRGTAFEIEGTSTGSATKTDWMTLKNGCMGIGTISPSAKIHIITGAAATKGALIKGSASQTANLLECQNSAGTEVFGVGPGGEVTQNELSADPADPDEGSFVTWMSDGTGSGDDGDIMMKITAGGSTKTTTLVDFSTL